MSKGNQPIKPPKLVQLSHLANYLGEGVLFVLNLPKEGDEDKLNDWAKDAVVVESIKGEDVLKYMNRYGTSFHQDITAILRLDSFIARKENLATQRANFLSMQKQIEDQITELKLFGDPEEEDYLTSLAELQENLGQVKEFLDQIELNWANVEKTFNIQVLYEEETGKEYYKVDGIGFVRQPIHMLIFQVCSFILSINPKATEITGGGEDPDSLQFKVSREHFYSLEAVQKSHLMSSLFYPASTDGNPYHIWYEIILAANPFPMQDRNAQDDDPKKPLNVPTTPQEMITSVKPSEKPSENASPSEEKPKE